MHRHIPVPPNTVGGALFLADCIACHGMWVGRETIERLVASHADDAILLALAPGVGAQQAASKSVGLTQVRYRPCPECTTMMNRINYARISGIIVDVCKEHGTWFDAHELPALLDFVRRGGLDVARQREVRSLADERRRLERERMMRMHMDQRHGVQTAAWNERRDSARAPSLFSLLGDLLSRR